MNILVIYPYIPYPLDRGTFQRTFHLLKELASEHKVDLLALSENGEAMEHREVFEQFCNDVRFIPLEHPAWPKLVPDRLFNSIPSTILHWRQPHIADAIRQHLNAGNYDLVHVCDIVLAQYFLDEHKDIPLSIDRSRVDLQFQLQRTAVMKSSLRDKALAWENMIKLWRFEKRIARRAQLQVLCGPDDEVFVRRHISSTVPLKVIANGVDLDFFKYEPDLDRPAEKPTLLFCGAMDYAPNIDALRWYFDTMHDELRRRVPDLQILIVGKTPVAEVTAYGHKPGVTVTGSVPDVRPYYRQAWMQMVPLRIGGGTRLKIVESLAIGTPVVSTTIGAQGLNLVHGDEILLADTPDAFIEQLAKGLSDPKLLANLRKSGIKTANERFSWHRIGTEFSAAFTGLKAQEDRVHMMDVPFDRVTMAGTLDRFGSMIAERKPHFIATANVDFLVQAKTDRELHQLLHQADMVVCDGTPLLWLSKLIGKPLPERVAGSDLVPQLLERAAASNWSVYFLGGREDILHQAVQNVQALHPKLRIAGSYSPPFAPLDAMDNDAICERIRAANPDILLVSFGCPKQEKWIARNHLAAGVPINIGVGATVDFLAGAVKRAPVWMRYAGLEWVFRLIQEPRRLMKRYALDAIGFAFGVLQEINQKILPRKA